MRKQKVNPKKLGFSKLKMFVTLDGLALESLYGMQWQLIFQAKESWHTATTKEGNPLWEQYSTRVVAHSLKVYSKYTIDYIYPQSYFCSCKMDWNGVSNDFF